MKGARARTLTKLRSNWIIALLATQVLLTLIHCVNVFFLLHYPQWGVPYLPALAALCVALWLAVRGQPYIAWSLGGNLLGGAATAFVAGSMLGSETAFACYGVGILVFGIKWMADGRKREG